MKKILAVILLVIVLVGIGIAKADDTRTITINKAWLSFGAYYSINENGKEIGTITGEFIKLFGDVFTYKDADGNVISSERESKKWARLSINRLAIVADKDENTLGYIGEDIAQSFFSLGYRFFFYDANQNEIAHTRQAVLSLLSKQKIYDNDDNVVAEINQNFTLFGASYTVTIYDDTLPTDQILFFACITDAISAEDD